MIKITDSMQSVINNRMREHMKRLICIILTAFVMLNIVGCDLNNNPLRISYDLKAEPHNLDPQTAKDTASLVIINNVFEGLFTVNRQGDIQNAIAKDYTVSDDGLKYNFTLREDAFWNEDNDKVKDNVVDAYDFEFAFQRLLSQDTNSPYAQLYYSIRNAKRVHRGELPPKELGVRAISRFELEIQLGVANSNFINLLTSTCTMPCNEEFFENTNGKYGLEAYTILSNGPFVISSWQHDTLVKLEKNDKYYDSKAVQVDSASLWIKTYDEKDDIGKDNTVERLNGEKTLAGFVDGFDIEKISDSRFNIDPIENTTFGLAFNVNNRLLANKNIRLAISASFDRASFEAYLPYGITAANAIIPHGAILQDGKMFREYAGENIAHAYDSKKAFEYYKAGLEELNREKASGFSLMIMESDNIDHSEYFSFASQIIQRELGVFFKVDMVDEKTYSKRLRAGDYDCVLVELEMINNTARTVLEQFVTGNSKNYYGYSSSTVDQIISQTAEQSDPRLINDAYAKVESIILADAVFIPMYYKRDYLVCSKNIDGMFYNKQTGLLSFKDIVRG